MELNPCPFCGGEASVLSKKKAGVPSGDDGIEVVVSCWQEGCGGRTVRWAMKEEWAKESAIASWNRRAEPEARELTCDGCAWDGQTKRDEPCWSCARNKLNRWPDNYTRKPKEGV